MFWGLLYSGTITFYTLAFHLKMKYLAFLLPPTTPQKNQPTNPFVFLAVYPVPLGPKYAVLKGASAAEA